MICFTSSLHRHFSLAALCVGLSAAPLALAAVSVQQVSNTSASVSYQVTYTGAPTYFRMYVDTDKSGSTGFKVGGIGANYLIENDSLYRYSGRNGSWNWRYLKSVTYSNSNQIAKWTVARADLGSPTAVNLIAQIEAPMENSAKVSQSLSTTGTTTPPPPTTPPSAVWVPPLNTSWQWQLTGLPIDQTVNVSMFDIDLFDNNASVIASLHSKGKKVICYFSAGSFENWRPDAAAFPASVLGSGNGWPGEKWLDIRNLTVLGPIMKARLDLAAQKGCDGVEPDNVDGYANSSGFPLTYANQIAFNRFIAAEAHARNLAVGLKNDLGQVVDLVPYFDFAVNEQCFEYSECKVLLPFINYGKAVFHVEYELPTSTFCSQANSMNFNSLKKNWSLDVTREACR
ncbi:MAG: endo alpha-1,4 polygalactosaminidase [Pseudomonadota bacterium]